MFFSKNCFPLIALFCVAALSLALKVTLLSAQAADDRYLNLIKASVALSAAGYRRVGHRQLINSHHYSAEIYSGIEGDPQCNALLFILLMPDNSEAESLITKPAGFASQDYFYILNGEISASFPSYKLWLRKIEYRLLDLVGFQQPPPVAFGISATSHCLNVRKLPWTSIIKDIYSDWALTGSQYANSLNELKFSRSIISRNPLKFIDFV